MVRPPPDKGGVKKGPWTPEEDVILVSYIQENGPGNWSAVPINTGLLRCSKSCRLRWTNYLRPGIKRGNFTPHEEGMIIHLQALLGNKWAAIATYLPQRTDNDIKNFWNTHLKKKLKKLESAAMVDTRSRGYTVSEESSTYVSSAENISRLLLSWSSSPSSSLQGNTITTTSDHYINSHKSFRDFGKIPTAVCDASSIEMQWCGISSDQEKVHFLHDQEMKIINGNPPSSFPDNWLLEENDASQDEDGMEILPIL